MEYKPRIADKLLAKKLRAKGAVLVEGAKWCGKTTTSEQIANSVLYLAKPETMLTAGKMAYTSSPQARSGTETLKS